MLFITCEVVSYNSKPMEKNNTQIDLLSDDVTIMTSSLRKVVCTFRIKFPMKELMEWRRGELIYGTTLVYLRFFIF